MHDCNYLGGAALINFDEDSLLTHDVVLNGCRSWNARIACTLPSWSSVKNCWFTQDETGYEYQVGSEHALYFFAGREQTMVQGCQFRGLYGIAVKHSGSSKPIVAASIVGNQFDSCLGGVVFGADDVQDHSGLVVSGNQFHNMQNGSAGFGCISVLGSRAVSIVANTFTWDRDSSVNPAGKYAISIAQYRPGRQPVESVLIEGNTFDARYGAGYASSPSAVLAGCINASNVGQGAQSGALTIQGNTFGVGATGVTCTQNLAPLIKGNVFKGVVTQISLSGDRCPMVLDNVLVPGPFTSTNAAIRMYSVSLPVIDPGISTGITQGFGNGGRTWSVSDNNGSGEPVDFPLLGCAGKVTPTDGREEALIAYGAGWSDGDTVSVNGTVVATYRASSPGVKEFNTVGMLISILDGLSGFGAADFGAPWNVATNHIRFRRDLPGVAGTSIAVQTVNRTAGVLPTNGLGSHLSSCYARGGQTTSPSNVVVWSPKAHLGVCPTFMPLEPSARLVSAINGYLEVSRSKDDSGQVVTVDVGVTQGSERWRWSL